ncbi:hypothetical protein [Streptomyces sp. NPDC050121]|uniref:hypothetical protein n=1 Tax=Streptomyces sp. NPDC050121 TaxID=3365601 RepID=UPI0037A37CD2
MAVINGSLLVLGQRNGGEHALQVLPGFEELGLAGDLGADVAGGDPAFVHGAGMIVRLM